MATSIGVERTRRLVWRPLVLAVEDDPVTAHLVRTALDRLGYLHAVATSRKETERFLAAWPVDALVLDVDLPDGSGLELIEDVRSRAWDPQPPILLCSGMSDRETVRTAVARGADDFLRKPVDVAEFSLRIRALLAGAVRPWEPWDEVMRRLGVTSGDYLEMLLDARATLDRTRREVEEASSPELLDSLVVRTRSLAGAVGNRALARSLDRLTRSWPRRDPGALAALLQREAARLHLLLDASNGASRHIAVPEAPEAVSGGSEEDRPGATAPARPRRRAGTSPAGSSPRSAESAPR